MASGLICNPNFHWIVFHGSYDFGYCLKLLSGEPLPQAVTDFFNISKLYFPKIHDIKHITNPTNRIYGGLNKMASILGVKRTGTKHQAGSDSLITLNVYKSLILSKEQLDLSSDSMIYGVRTDEE